MNRKFQSSALAALAALAGIGAGAAIMYLLDPGRGARRRHRVADKARSFVRSGARDVRDATVNARNHAAGAVHEARARFEDEQVPDDLLVDRVRSQLGHHVDHPRAIQVFADHGTVVLTGTVPPDEIEPAVKAAESVRGVECVENRLSAGDPERTTTTA